MRTVTSLACISLLSLLSACGSPSDGRYDANGNYVPYDRYNMQARNHSPLQERSHRGQVGYEDNASVYNTPDYTYDRRGYYDYNGHYVAREDSLRVPQNMFPPRGMCRVWFTERAADNQPPIESCNGIRSRVPTGAYVIYGG